MDVNNTNRYQYIDWLFKTYPKEAQDFFNEWKHIPLKELKEWFWYSPQITNWRLSHRGYLILDHFFNFQFSSIETTDEKLTGFQFLAIDRYIKSPYFIKKNVLFLLDSKCVVELKMFYNGDLTKFFDAKVRTINSKNRLHA